MRKSAVWLLCLLFIYCRLQAQYPGFTLLTNTADFRQQFSAAAHQTNSIKSDFSQEKTLSMLSDKIISRGKFWFKKENRVRMEYTQPFSYLMILDNGRVYIRDGQKENKLYYRFRKSFPADQPDHRRLRKRKFTHKP